MSDRLSTSLSLSDKDDLVYQNRSQEFSKDATTFAIDPLGKIAVICGKRGLFFVRLEEEKLDIHRTVRDTKNAGKDISGVRWSRNPNILASTCLQEISLWDLNSTSAVPLLSKVGCHRRAITGFDWSNHQESVYATSSFDTDSLVYLWDSRDAGAPVKFHALRSPFGGASAVKWSRREEHLLAASNGTQLLVWDVRKESAPIVVIPADLKALVDFDWSYRDDTTLLTCAPGSIKFWNLSNPRKAIGTLQTAAIRARFNPFSRSCVTLTGQADHSWDLWNLSDISTPYLVKEYGVDDWNGARRTLGPLSKFNWRRVLVGSSFEYQLVTWSTKDQLFSMWRVGADELSACGVEPSKTNKSWSAKLAAESSIFESSSMAATSSAVTSASSPLAHTSVLSDSGSDWEAGSGQELTFTLPSVAAPSSSGSDAFGSGRLWDAASADSHDSESATSTPGATNRSRANSSSLAPPYPLSSTGSSDSLVTSPPGSFKAALTSPGSHKRAISGTHNSTTLPASSTRQTLPRPVPFEAELDHLMRRPLVGLTLERIDKVSRMALFSLRRGKTHVEIRITFPTMYPNGAPPSFTVLTNTSVATTVKTKEILVDTAQDFVSLNRNCLAPAFSQLIEYLGTQDDEVLETSAIEQSSKDVEENLTRNRRPSLTLSSPLAAISNAASHLSVRDANHSASGMTSPRGLAASNAASEFMEYVVKPTDSLAAIALFYNMTVGELRRLNKIQHSVQLLPGQLLLVKRLPAPSPTHSTSASSSSSTATSSAASPAAAPHPSNLTHAHTTGLGFVGARPHSHSVARATIGHPPPGNASLRTPTKEGPGAFLMAEHPRLAEPGSSPSEAIKNPHTSALSKTIHGIPKGVTLQDFLATSSEKPSTESRTASSSSGSTLASATNGSGARSIPATPTRGPHAPFGEDLVNASPMVGSFLGSPSGLKSRSKLFDSVSTAVPSGSKEDAGLHAMRAKFVDRTLNPPALIEGLLTATPLNLFFEPDLDQPAVVQRGALHYSIFLEMKKVREAVDLKSMNLSLSAVGDGEGGVYLQILTKDRQTINHSKVLLFLCQSQTKAEETSKAMTRWISDANERSLLDGLGLDAVGSYVPPSSMNASASSAGGAGASSHSPLDFSTPRRTNVAGDIIGSVRSGSALLMRESGANLRASGLLGGGASSRTPVPAASSSGDGKFGLATSPSSSTAMPSLSGNPNQLPNQLSHPLSPTKSDAARLLLGRPPSRPAPIVVVAASSSHSNPSSVAGDSAVRPVSPLKLSTVHISAVPVKAFVGSKLLPNEDPDDLPQILGNAALLTSEMVWSLRGSLPFRFKYHDWKLTFSTSVHGTSLLTFYKHLENKAPTVLVVRDTDGHIFGGFASVAWHVSKSFFGTGESFLFSLIPNFAVYTWTGADDYYCIGRKEFLAMGGGGASGRYGLWLDSELSAGTSEVSKTFLNRRLSLNEEFTCSVVEVYSLVPK
jgi:LysM repeat protein